MMRRSRSKTRVPADKYRDLYLIRKRYNGRLPALNFGGAKKVKTALIKSNSKRTPPSTSFYFPEELVEEILSRVVDVKSLIRCKCVCKSWCNLISSQGCFTFLLQYCNNCNDSIIWKTSISTASFMPTSSAYTVEADSPGVLQYPKYSLIDIPRYYPNFTGPCNGIFCLHSVCADNIVLWNPAPAINQDFKIIPKPNSPRYGQLATFSTVGFGFDPETKDYKILQVVLDVFDLYPPPLQKQFELYSLSTNSWRKLDIYTPANSFNITPYSTRFTAADGKLMGWLVSEPDLSGVSKRYQLLMFDTSSETFDMIPVSLDGEFVNRKVNLCVFPFRESIAVVTDSGKTPEGRRFEIWVLNDFSSSQPRFWSKLWTIEHNKLVHKPQGFWGNWGLIFLHRESRNLTLYDFLNQDLVDFGVGIPGASTFKAFAYKESLVSLSS